jgi:ribosomal protein RSM22 (predicted rRNA methylase)
VIIGEKQALRTRAGEIAEAVDKELNSIERLYADTVKVVRKGRAAEMLTRMKQTRATGAALILAHEQGDHRKVVQDEPAVTAYLAQTRKQFEEAGQR